MKNLIFSLVFIVFQFVTLSQESNKIYCELYLTQKNISVTTDYFIVSFYDNVKEWGNTDSIGILTGYQVKIVFIADDTARYNHLSKLFYQGADCKIIFRFWDEYLTGKINLFKIESTSLGVVTVNAESKSELKRISQKSATWKYRFR